MCRAKTKIYISGGFSHNCKINNDLFEKIVQKVEINSIIFKFELDFRIYEQIDKIIDVLPKPGSVL